MITEPNEARGSERACVYRVLRYTPNLVRDEWLNIGVLVFDPETGERRLRMIEDADEYARVRRLHPQADEALLRALRDDLENRFASASVLFAGNGNGEKHGETGGNEHGDWLKLLGKWDETLSNALQLAPQKGTYASDLDAETERLYGDHVAVSRQTGRAGVPGSRGVIRSYCAQVLKQARVGAAGKRRARRGVYVSRGSDAAGLRLPAQSDARLRADPERFAGTGGCQAAGVYRGSNTRQGEVQRVYRGDRCAAGGGKRAAPLCAGNAARCGCRERSSGRIRGLDRQDAADDSMKRQKPAKLQPPGMRAMDL